MSKSRRIKSNNYDNSKDRHINKKIKKDMFEEEEEEINNSFNYYLNHKITPSDFEE